VKLVVMTGCYCVGDVTFEGWEVETIEDVTADELARVPEPM
jgi:hypothetical protein